MATYQGMPVNTEMLPAEIRAPISLGASQKDFEIRLKEGGTLTLDGNELVIGSVDYSSNSSAFIALDVLELKNGATIITNGNVFSVFCNKIISDNGRIIAFRPNEKKAKKGLDGVAPGEAGQPGQPGDSGGIVSIHVIDQVVGILHVDLSGQDGGDGGNGNQGASGVRGYRGADAVQGYFPGPIPVPYCERGGQDGGKGGTGLPGGNGGNAGHGGLGGHFELVNVGPQPLPETSVQFVAKGGIAGSLGAGGTGGEGGLGGEGGSGSLSCGGGHGGSQGDRGAPGSEGFPGKPGSPGSSLVKNLDLQIVINRAISGA